MVRLFSMLSKSEGRRKRKPLCVESLEPRTLLTSFYVNGVGGDVQDGSPEAPFATINQGIEAALQNPGGDEVVILPKSTGPYTTPIAIVPGYSDLQVQGFSVFNGDLTIRGGGDSPDDVVIDTSFGDGIYVDAPIGVTVQNLTINQSGRHGILYRSQQPLTVENVQITNHTNYTGIIVQGSELTVRDSTLVNNLQGIWGGIGTIGGTNTPTNAPGNLTVVDSVSRNNVRDGVFLRDITGVATFTNFSASQNPRHGIWVTESAAVEFAGGTYSGNGFAGLNIVNTGSVSVHDLTASGNGRNGIVSTLNQSLEVNGVTLEGNGTTAVSYNPGGGGMHVRPGSATPITVSNSVIRGNRNWGNAGGIEFWGPQTDFMANAIISNSILEDNATLLDGSNGRGQGGAIASIGNTHLTLISSTIQGNAAYSGGGVFLSGFNSINDTFAGLTLIDSTIADNQSTSEGGGITQRTGQTEFHGSTISGNSGAAGGVWMTSWGGVISNTTISGNHGGAYGGAYVTSRNALSVVNSTVTDNFGFLVGGIHSTGNSAEFLNTIVAQNGLTSSEGFPMAFQESDLTGAIRSLGHNIFGEVENVTISSDRVTGPGPHSTDIFGTVLNPANAMLGPLADNGGPTLTHGLQPQSPGINGGVSTVLVPATDQRGYARAGQADIGAVENQAPVGVADSAITDEDTPVNIDVLLNDFERDGETFSVVQVQDATGGTALVNDDGTILFTPNANFNGLATFSYVLEDAAGLRSVTPVSITVVPVNDAPVAQDDFVVLDEDTLARIGVLGNDADIDGDVLSVNNIVTQPTHGNVQINDDGTITYTPIANFHGTDSFVYQIADGQGGFASATVSVVVDSVNDAPVASVDSATTTEDMAVTVSVTANDTDIDGDTLTVSGITTEPANGAVEIVGDGQIVYTPDVDFSGTDSFVYEITDGNGGTSTAVVTVTVISRQQQMNTLKAQVQQLLDSRVISSRQARTLQGYLKFGKDAARTISSLNQFQAEVQQLIDSQTLSSTIGQMLIADAEKLKQSVSIFASSGGGGGGGGGKGGGKGRK